MDHAAPLPSAQQILDGIRDYAIFALDAEGRIAAWGAGAERVTGWTAEAALGKRLDLLTPPVPDEEGGSAGGEKDLARRAADAGSAEREGWRARGDGTRFWARETVTALRGQDGALGGFAVVMRDDTARHDAEAALRASQTTFAGILEIASDAVVCVGEKQTVTFFNRGAEVIFGYQAGEVIGQPLEMLIPGYARAGHAEHVRRFGEGTVVARRMGERGEITGLRKSGEVFPAEASISKLIVGGTRVYTAVLRDVSERRRAEEALNTQAQELARSNADLEQFAYVASHDLQEPLRMVASYTQLLARRYKDRLDDDAHEFIAYAVDGVTRMQALINDLLAYSRAGSRTSTPVPTDLNAVLQRVLVSLAAAIEESGAEVTSGPLPTLPADGSQIAQVLQNLIGNAIKFRGEQPPRVHVSARLEGGTWTLSVRDNGIGIAPEFAERIWVIFQRLHSRAEYPGTGIGLAICKKIVERHGGRIWVQPAPEGGSDFRFTLPQPETAA
jgi:PAS domain S-box-containing protein